MLIPLMAYLATFSDIRMLEMRHFQFHAASVPLLALVAACLDFLKRPSRRSVLLIALSELLLLYTAPYMAVLGACLLLVWFGFAWVEGLLTPITFFKEHWSILIPAMLLFLPGLWPYFNTSLVVYPRSEIIRFSMKPAHLFASLERWGLKDIPAFATLRGGAVPGSGLLLTAVIAGVLGFCRYRSNLLRFLRRRTVWIWILLFVLTWMKIREIKTLSIFLRLGLWGVLWVGLIRWRRQQPSSADRDVLFLALTALFLYGIALGPDPRFEFQWLDPGIWGVFSRIIPGFGNMRQVIRFATLGQSLALGVLFWFFLRAWALRESRRVWLLTGLGAAILLQTLEVLPSRAPRTRVDPGHFTFSPRAEAFFRDFEGSLLVIPATPFHLNTYAMLRFSAMPGIRLVNGYSARSNDLLDALMRLEREGGQASEGQIRLARRAGVDAVLLLTLDKDAISRMRAEADTLYDDGFQVVFSFRDSEKVDGDGSLESEE